MGTSAAWEEGASPEVEEGERSDPDGTAGDAGRPASGPPDPEVPEVARRRRFTAAYKLRVLEEAERCTEPGELGALLRREGLYSDYLAKWRRQRERGGLAGLTPRKRGRKPKPQDPSAKELKRLKRENTLLKRKLEQAELIMDIQKKYPRCWGSP